MKWKFLYVAAVAATAALPAVAQESRQDVSISATGLFAPYVPASSTDVSASADKAVGALVSYRYDLTPRSGLEANYGYTQTTFYLNNGSNAFYTGTRIQEISGAYVYSLNFGKWNPYVEGGVGGFIFSPIQDQSSGFSPRQNTNVGALYGGGIAYEISPSFDIRAGYRGIVVKYPDFNISSGSGGAFQTRRYTNISDPAIGIAYHF